MTGLLKLIPSWAWPWVVVVVVGVGQEVRVWSAQGERDAERAARLEDAGKIDACRTTRTNLLELTIEQNGALANLRASEHDRAQRTEEAQQQARAMSETDYQAANRLQQERTGGDACAAAEAVIDKELGL